jgi:hypothetical protein
VVEVGQVQDLQVEAADAGPLPPRPELVDDLRNRAPEVERVELVRLLADRLRPAGRKVADVTSVPNRIRDVSRASPASVT